MTTVRSPLRAGGMWARIAVSEWVRAALRCEACGRETDQRPDLSGWWRGRRGDRVVYRCRRCGPRVKPPARRRQPRMTA